MTSVRVLRVFTDRDGASGNALGVVRDAGDISQTRRQAIAAELGYSETVFVERDTDVQIFTPTTELPFAGHPLVGSAWLLDRPLLRTPAGAVEARAEGDQAWVLARPQWCPDYQRIELEHPDDVHAFEPPRSGSVNVWAWSDEARGEIRARVFAPDVGVPEDPATGSAAVPLCAELQRAVTIEQGPGCLIDVRQLDDGRVELGGRVADDGVREI